MSPFKAHLAAWIIESRPPCLPPRRRQLAADVVGQLSRWTRQALGLHPGNSVRVEEWVATDSRAVPHVVHISFAAGDRSQLLTVCKASERIVYADIVRALPASSESATGVAH